MFIVMFFENFLPNVKGHRSKYRLLDLFLLLVYIYGTKNARQHAKMDVHSAAGPCAHTLLYFRLGLQASLPRCTGLLGSVVWPGVFRLQSLLVHI